MPAATLNLNGEAISLADFYRAIKLPCTIAVNATIDDKLQSTYKHVIASANDDKPVYGLNTGLGANLSHRLSSDEIADFQLQIVAGRAVACGDPLSPVIGRGALLSRILTAANGFSGISPELFTHLCSVFNAKLAPAIPQYGSIGASDLTQNAHLGLSVCGLAPIWRDGKLIDATDAFKASGISCPELQPKDGMVLVNHSGVTVSLSAIALHEARIALDMAKQSIVLSYVGYDANQQILADATNELRPAHGQRETAKWFREALAGSANKPRRIQEALSFRTIAPIIGAAEHALSEAILIWEDEANGIPDSPVIMPDGAMHSTSNFHTPALALALQTLSLSLVSVANGSVQRMQRMMDPTLSGLPKYLSRHEGRSAGFVPTQKTALSLLADISHHANPVMMNPNPVSDAVEDMATLAPQAATKLTQQLKACRLLFGLEALVACQAIDLRDQKPLGSSVENVHGLIREKIPMLDADRAMGADIDLAAEILGLYVGL